MINQAKRHFILSRQYRVVLDKLKSCSDKHFEKWLSLSKIIKEEIIACELSGVDLQAES